MSKAVKGRPEALFPLFAEIETLDGVGPKIAKHLEQIHVEKPRDLLFTLPYNLIDRRRRATILGADLPQVLTVEVTVGVHRAPRTNVTGQRVAACAGCQSQRVAACSSVRARARKL